jgi:phenylacetate-CoA ligase
MEVVRTWSLLRELSANVHASPQTLRAVQDALFCEALHHAYAQVPFYRRYWKKEGFSPTDVRGIKDLKQVPVLTDEAARRAVAQGELAARDSEARNEAALSTTGSAGRPLEIPRGRHEERLWRAQGLRIWREHGYRWTHKKIQIDRHAGTSHPLQRFGISQTDWVSPDVSLKELRDRLLSARADWIIVTPTVLRRLARALAGEVGMFRQPRSVVCQGEILDKRTREVSRQLFGHAPVDVYAMSEVGYMAWQCECRAGLHVNADTHLIEVLDGDRAVAPGKVGNLVITDLRNRVMPFLRYQNGDLAVAGDGPCACGRLLPCLESIEGRQRDALRLEDGRLVTARAMIDHLADLMSVDDYRLHQEAPDRFRIEVFLEAQAIGSERVSTHVRHLLGDVQVTVERSTRVCTRGPKTYPIVIDRGFPPFDGRHSAGMCPEWTA